MSQNQKQAQAQTTAQAAQATTSQPGSTTPSNYYLGWTNPADIHQQYQQYYQHYQQYAAYAYSTAAKAAADQSQTAALYQTPTASSTAAAAKTPATAYQAAKTPSSVYQALAQTQSNITPVQKESAHLKKGTYMVDTYGNPGHPLWITNLNKAFTVQDLVGLLSNYGKVLWCELTEEGKSSFIRMESMEAVWQCVYTLNNYTVKGSKLNVIEYGQYLMEKSVASQANLKVYDKSTLYKLFVGSIPKKMGPEKIKKLFEPFGHVVYVERYRSVTYAYVYMEYEEDARKAMVALHRIELGGKRLVVGPSEDQKLPDIPTVKLSVTNISHSVTADQMRRLFSAYGLVPECEIWHRHFNCVLAMETVGDIRSAINEMSQYSIGGMKLAVKAILQKKEEDKKRTYFDVINPDNSIEMRQENRKRRRGGKKGLGWGKEGNSSGPPGSSSQKGQAQGQQSQQTPMEVSAADQSGEPEAGGTYQDYYQYYKSSYGYQSGGMQFPIGEKEYQVPGNKNYQPPLPTQDKPKPPPPPGTESSKGIYIPGEISGFVRPAAQSKSGNKLNTVENATPTNFGLIRNKNKSIEK